MSASASWAPERSSSDEGHIVVDSGLMEMYRMREQTTSMFELPAAKFGPHEVRPEWPALRYKLGMFVNCRRFEVFIGIMLLTHLGILINETNLTAEVVSGLNLDSATEGIVEVDIPVWMSVLGNTFLLIYIIELMSKLYVHRYSFFLSGWNTLDFTVVVADVFVQTVLAFFAQTSAPLRILKIMRVVKLARTLSILASFRELYDIMHSLFAAMKAVFWASLLIALVLTICSVFAVQLIHPLNLEIAHNGAYDGCQRCSRAFSSVWQSNLTFFQSIVTGDSWGLVAIPIIEAYPWTAVLFVTVYVTVGLGLLNLILTVIVDRATDARQENSEAAHQLQMESYERARQKLMDVCCEIDDNGDQQITLKEIFQGMDSKPDFSSAMDELHIKKDDLAMVFSMIDEERVGSVTYAAFVDNLHKMKTHDDHAFLVLIRHHLNELRFKVQDDVILMKEEMVKLERIDDSVRQLVLHLVATGEESHQPLKPAHAETRELGVCEQIVPVKVESNSNALSATARLSQRSPLGVLACSPSAGGGDLASRLAELRAELDERLAALVAESLGAPSVGRDHHIVHSVHNQHRANHLRLPDLAKAQGDAFGGASTPPNSAIVGGRVGEEAAKDCGPFAAVSAL